MKCLLEFRLKQDVEVISDCRYVSVLVRNARVHVKFVSNGTKSLTLKYLIVKKFSSDTLRDENILSRTIFTQKYPTVNFSQTTVSPYSNNVASYGELFAG